MLGGAPACVLASHWDVPMNFLQTSTGVSRALTGMDLTDTMTCIHQLMDSHEYINK